MSEAPSDWLFSSGYLRSSSVHPRQQFSNSEYFEMAGESLVVANESFYKAWIDSAVEEGPHPLFSVFLF